MKVNVLFNGDGIELLKSLPNSSIKCILTDPPYLYLKNQKLDRPFDEQTFFAECKRVLTDDGFIVLFGRGTSFYRWNTILSDLNFTFKEEIVWDKQYTSSPVLPISRVHETISIHCKGIFPINRCKVPYVEAKGYDLKKMIDDINRIKTCFNNTVHFDNVLNYLKTRKRTDYNETRYATTHSVTFSSKRLGSRVLNPVQSMVEGMNEKDIIRIRRDHYTTIHPTQKPIALLKRLLALVTKPGDIVVDPFGGSFSTACACIETGNTYICAEIDNEYYTNGANRVSAHLKEFNT